jgi:uncharacterized protein YxjI
MPISYPLKATFRFFTLSPEIQVRDANDNLLLQVKQKLLSLREDTTVFADLEKTTPLYRMKADRVIGFRAVHHITRLADNVVIGAVRAAGLRSLWQARYSVTDSQEQVVLNVREENPWIKLIDALVDEIPLVGPLISMFINPRYLMEDSNGVLHYRITKQRSLVGRNFLLEQMRSDNRPDLDERLVALALIQVVFLERNSG